MSGWAGLLGRYPWFVLAAIALLSVAALAALRDPAGGWRIAVDPTLDALVVPGIATQLTDDEVHRRFSAREQILVVVRGDDVFSAPILQRIHALSRALFELPGVAQVQSLTTISVPVRRDGTLEFVRYDAGSPDSSAAREGLRAAAHDNPLVRGQLVSEHDHAATIVVEVDDREVPGEAESGLPDRIRQIADGAATDGVAIHVTGAPVLRAATGAAVLGQLRWVVPTIALLVVALLAVAFRTWYGVLLPLATMAIAVLVTLWTFAFIGRPLNLVTSLVPTLVATMTLAYCAHVISEFDALVDAHPQMAASERVVALLRLSTAPVALTGFTTAVGLAALMLTNLPAIRSFAWLSVLGVVVAAALALSFVPAVLAYVRIAPGRSRREGSFERIAGRIGAFDMRRRRAILLVAGVVFVLSLAFATTIRIGDQFIGVFEPNARVRVDYEAANAALGGVTPLTILVDGFTPGVLTEPEYLRALASFQDWLRAQPEVGSVLGLVDHVQVLNRTLGNDADARLPQVQQRVEQLLFFGDSHALRQIVNADRSATLIQARLTADDTHDVGQLLARLRARLATLPPPLTGSVAGEAAIITESVDAVTSGQIQSIVLALVLIYACLALQFASLRIGLLVSVPTLLQTAIYFGALGISGVTLNATTSLVECLVLGLAVDDTIHYLARFGSAARDRASETRGAVDALRAVLRPVTLTKAILGLGFIVLVLGDLHNQVLFGWLATFTLFAAWLVDVFVTPAFMSGVRIVTLWDSLRVNLGDNVQSTIPLLKDLTPRQARMFALMANLQTVPPGTRLITEGEDCGIHEVGDPRGDVYVVIDGTVEAWVEREGRRVVLSRFSRGGVVGEVGYFGQKRTANVDTVTAARLLRFDDADQERICRLYPRIAARVFLNLNRLQAERRALQHQPAG